MDVCSDFKHISYRKTSPHNSPKLSVWLQHVDREQIYPFRRKKKKKKGMFSGKVKFPWNNEPSNFVRVRKPLLCITEQVKKKRIKKLERN